MAISRKPKKETDISEAVIKAIIEKGGSIAAQDNLEEKKKNLKPKLKVLN